MARKSPTTLSMRHLKTSKYVPAIVEKVIPKSFIKQDLYGFIDIVAIHADIPGILGIQATSRNNHLARVKKCMNSRNCFIWLKAGNNFQIWSWKYVRDKDSKHYKLKSKLYVTTLYLEDPSQKIKENSYYAN